jgi:hypothetical protein
MRDKTCNEHGRKLSVTALGNVRIKLMEQSRPPSLMGRRTPLCGTSRTYELNKCRFVKRVSVPCFFVQRVDPLAQCAGLRQSKHAIIADVRVNSPQPREIRVIREIGVFKLSNSAVRFLCRHKRCGD